MCAISETDDGWLTKVLGYEDEALVVEAHFSLPPPLPRLGAGA